MPLLTVVVAVHGVQGYLRQCLDSILNQPFSDFELIAVDDASPDHCPAILDEYAERDARVRVLHLPANIGLGPARNAGLEHATGDYVWFVDGDDTLARGALPVVGALLRSTQPDLLVVDHTRVDWLGRHSPSSCGRLLGDGRSVVTLAEQPRLIEVLHVAWNKIIKRTLLTSTGLDFPPGWYEDVPFSYPLLVLSRRIATLRRVCYHYRQRRDGAITTTADGRHFEALDQWSRAFDRLDAIGEPAAPYRPLIFARMIWHLLIVLGHPARVPVRRRREFFHRIHQLYCEQHRPRTPLPAGVASLLQLVMVAGDHYWTYRLLRRIRLLARRIRAGTQRRDGRLRGRLRRLKSIVGIGLYRVMLWFRVDPQLAVYAAYWYRGFGGNPAAIYQKARELRPDIRGVWIVRRGRPMPAGVPHAVAGSLRYYWLLARARYLINDVNFPDFVVKRPGTIHVQTHHGTPVKTMGLDQAAYPIGAKGTDFAALMRRCDRWDFSLSANAHSTEVWARAYPCRYETLEVGYPRNDRLARPSPADVAAARAAVGAGPDQTVVLYAPTHREYTEGAGEYPAGGCAAEAPAQLDVEEFAAQLEPQMLILARHHDFSAAEKGSGAAGAPVPVLAGERIRDVTDHPDLEQLLLAADVLITDYSSVMFDYAVLDRPIVIYAPDWDAYRRTRGVVYDVIAEPPGLVATSLPDLVDAFRNDMIIGDAANKARAKFRERFCYLDDGHAAERVVRRVFG